MKTTKQKEDATSGLQREWYRPLCSIPQVGRLKGPKPVACDDQFGNSPDDRTNIIANRTIYYIYARLKS